MAISRRNLIRNALAVSATCRFHSFGLTKPTKLATVGWVWEGQGVNAPVAPSIYGVGEGAKYFGLKKVVFMFHPNNDMAMWKLRRMDEVVCDVTKYSFSAAGNVGEGPESNRTQLHYDLERVPDEVKNLARLSLTYGNIRGAFLDDFFMHVKRGEITAEEHSRNYDALKSANPALRFWVPVYAHELGEDWVGFKPYMDVINLWLWNPKDIPSLDRHVERCQKVFPGKPIVLGCYLWDYSLQSSMPMDMLKLQWEGILRHIEAGIATGYSILGTFLIDGARQQAQWVRDFIATN